MEPFKLKSRYYYIRLTEEEQKIYRQIYDAWHTGGTKATLTLPGRGRITPSGRDLHDIVTFLVHDNPHLFHLETSQFLYNRLGDTVTIEVENVYTPEEYQKIYQALNRRVDEILAKARQYPTDMERVRFLHDYLAENITYDYGKPDPRSQREVHTIVGALLNSACVCDGYSRAFRLLCDRMHISCIVVTGEGFPDGKREGHAWNIVKIDGKVYHCDVTWDSNWIAAGSFVRDYYFLRSDKVFKEAHDWDTKFFHPITEDAPRAYPILRNKKELESCVCDAVRKGKKELIVHMDDSFPDQDKLLSLVSKIMDRNKLLFLTRGIFGCSVQFSDKGKAGRLEFK